MIIKAIIFDFDGTILDTESPEYNAWKYVFQQYDIDLPIESWALALGTKEEHFDGCSLLEESTSRQIDRNAILVQKNLKSLEYLDNQKMLPGVLDHIKRAKSLEIKLGIASSSNRTWVDGHLKRLELISYFDAVTTSDDVSHTKPEPDLYLKTLTNLKCDCRNAIAYEDSPNGILAAKAAGIKCIAIPNPISVKMDFHFADLIIDSLATTSLDKLIRLISE